MISSELIALPSKKIVPDLGFSKPSSRAEERRLTAAGRSDHSEVLASADFHCQLVNNCWTAGGVAERHLFELYRTGEFARRISGCRDLHRFSDERSQPVYPRDTKQRCAERSG